MTAEVHAASSPPTPTDDFGSIYEENYGLLVRTAIVHYRISETDAQSLAHEVFLAYFLKSHEIINARAWLVGAVRNASMAYRRSQARLVTLPPRMMDTADPKLEDIGERLPDQLAGRQAFSCMTARCQVALRLRYLEGYRMPEVAEELNISLKYAEKLVWRCLRQARSRYRQRGEQK